MGKKTNDCPQTEKYGGYSREVSGVNFSYVGEPDNFGMSFELANHLLGKELDWSITENGDELNTDLPGLGFQVDGRDRRPGEVVSIHQTGYYRVIWEYTYSGEEAGHSHTHISNPNFNNNFPSRVVLASGQSQQIVIGPATGVVIERVAMYTTPSSGSVNYYNGRVLVPGLVELGNSPAFHKIGRTFVHPSNHFVTPATKNALWAIAQEYYSSTGQALYFNDASLPWGGIFDLGQNFSPPHHEHRNGTSIDIAATSGTLKQEAKFLEILSKHTTNYILEGTGHSRHYHVRF